MDVANSNHTPEQKERLAMLGAVFEPTYFDVNFVNDRRATYPTNLDQQIKQMIRES